MRFFIFPTRTSSSWRGDDIALHQALEIANRHLCEAVLGVSRMLLEPGMLNVSFADLQASVRGRHSLGSVVHVEASGENRADDAGRMLLAHPAARGGETLKQASSLLVHLSGADVTMAEMNVVTEAISNYSSSAKLVVGVSGQGREEALQLTVVIAHAGKLAGLDQESTPPKPDPTGQASDLGYSDSFTVPDTGSYLDLGKETNGKNRSGFAYTPPAPTADALTQECRENLIRVAVKEESNRTKRRKIVQELLPLEIVSMGRFEKSEPTIHKGEDLDQPTYIRRGAVLN